MKALRRSAASFLCSLSLITLSTTAFAQYPEEPIRFVVPYPPGSVTDLLARTLGNHLAERWSQPVVVENRGGGGSVIGTDLVARAPADGYTILLVAPDLAINESLHKRLPYDARKSFAPVLQLVTSPTVLIVNPSLPVTSVEELLAFAKENPDKLTYASGGNGTVGHLGMELLKHMGGFEALHVPYKGTAAVVRAVMAGEVDLAFAQMSTVQSQMASGQLRALATASGERSNAMPDLPTVAEAGVQGYAADVWFGVVAPAATPAPIIQQLNTEMASVMDLPGVRQLLQAQGIEPRTGNPDEFARLIDNEIKKWADIVERTGSRVD